MSEGEEEAEPQRPSPVVHHESCTVVDRRNMVRVERMPNAQDVGNHAHADVRCSCWERPGMGKVETPTGCVEHEDASGDEEQGPPGTIRHVVNATCARTACHVP